MNGRVDTPAGSWYYKYFGPAGEVCSSRADAARRAGVPPAAAPPSAPPSASLPPAGGLSGPASEAEAAAEAAAAEAAGVAEGTRLSILWAQVGGESARFCGVVDSAGRRGPRGGGGEVEGLAGRRRCDVGGESSRDREPDGAEARPHPPPSREGGRRLGLTRESC